MSKSRRKQVEIVDVTFRSPHQELSESEKAYVRRKLQKLARFFHKLWALEVTYELRDTGQYGFLLPPDQILPTCEEVYPAFLELLRWARQRDWRE